LISKGSADQDFDEFAEKPMNEIAEKFIKVIGKYNLINPEIQTDNLAQKINKELPNLNIESIIKNYEKEEGIIDYISYDKFLKEVLHSKLNEDEKNFVLLSLYKFTRDIDSLPTKELEKLLSIIC